MLVFSLLGNSLVVVSFALNNLRTKTSIDVFIVNLAVLGLVECLFTQSLSCGYSVENEWIFGAFLMSLNAAFVQIKNIGVLLTISLIVVDSYITTSGNGGKR